MPTNTYVALDKVTTTGSVSSIEFTSINQGYTDLVIVANVQQVTLGEDLALQFNSDTGTNYSRTYLCGDGSTAHSGRSSNSNYIILDHHATPPTGTSFSTAIINIMNYSNSTTYKTVLDRTGANDTNPGLGTVANVGMWRNTSAITSVKVFCTNGSNIKTGSTFSLYGIAAEGTGYATGGYITSDAEYYYHTFTASGTFTPLRSLTADYLVVAGGGGGGAGHGGGGGAGGFRSASAQALSATGYAVTIGAGGAGAISGGNNAGTQGGNSSLNSLTSAGGGYGGSRFVGAGSGGSGGGGSFYAAGASGNTPSTSPVQGYNGGNNGTVGNAGGGGGGATQNGFNSGESAPPNAFGASGGAGSNAFSSWASVTSTGSSGYYAGGGGGGGYLSSGGAGGSGGGGLGGTNAGGTGSANTGGGGGGGAYDGTQAAGGNGGSGIVIIRYAKA